MTDHPTEGELSPRVAKLESGFDHLSRSMDTLSSKLDQVVSVITSSNKTHWGTLGTWAGVIVVLMAMWTKPMMDDTVRVELAAERNRATANENENDVIRLQKDVEYLWKDLKEHEGEADHPWGVLDSQRNLEVELEGIKANRFTSAQGAEIEARLKALEDGRRAAHE